VRARGGYDVFGAAVAESGAAVGQPFGFTGREHELESGLVYARARYLSPATGQWTQPDPVGAVAGPNYYSYVRDRATGANDPTGLLSTVDVYAMRFPFAFLALAQDLGVIPTAALMVGTAAAAAVPISQVISNTRDEDRTTVKVCPVPQPTRPERTYYRGLSIDDLHELMIFGQIYSKFLRLGFGGFLEALEYFVTGVVNHPYSSEQIAPGIPSPFVGVTGSRWLAEQFSHSGDRPGHVTISFTTTRVGVYSRGPFAEDETLFFMLLGEPGERMEVVAQ